MGRKKRKSVKEAYRYNGEENVPRNLTNSKGRLEQGQREKQMRRNDRKRWRN
jgi:hypothetical protein